jgi:hypothetical protein
VDPPLGRAAYSTEVDGIVGTGRVARSEPRPIRNATRQDLVPARRWDSKLFASVVEVSLRHDPFRGQDDSGMVLEGARRPLRRTGR